MLTAVLAAYAWYTRKHDLAAAIRRDFVASGSKVVDLPKSVPFGWTRVCVVGPHADAQATSALLGFDWNSDAHSRIRSSDTTVLLVFTNKNIVLGAADYSRELTPWAGKCYPRSAARFRVLL